MEEEDELWSGATWCDSSCIYYFCIYVFVTFKYVCALHKLLKIHLHITYTYSYSTFTFNIRFRALRALLCLCHSHLLIRPAAFDFCVSCQMYLQLQHFIIINAREHVYSPCVSVYLYLCISCALLPMTASSVWQYFVILNYIKSILNKSQVCPFLKQKTLIRTVEREFFLSSINSYNRICTLKCDCCLNSRQKL